MAFLPKKITSSQIIVLGFLGAILLGALLLMLPFATADGRGASFADALFTATSATCVTGLIVQDTATYWSGFGQAVILIMIQIGGMGVVTIAVAVSVASGKKIGLMQRSTMQEAISAPQMGGIVTCRNISIRERLLRFLFGSKRRVTVLIPEYSSLTYFSDNPLINITIMTLIIVGGIGFLVWQDVKVNKIHLHRYRMQSKLVLITSAVLIVLPAIAFFVSDFSGMPLRTRILSSIFQSVTTRTAGFNTADLTQMNSGNTAVMIVLMLIGGSPGSTAGGMKTTTLAVLILTAVSVFRRKEHTNFAGRSIADSVMRNAIAIVTMYVSLFLAGGVVITVIEKLPMMTCMFETASAIGTVGLTLGITPSLGPVSRVILIFLMYIGRVGGLTLIFSALTTNQSNMARLPQEKITVG